MSDPNAATIATMRVRLGSVRRDRGRSAFVVVSGCGVTAAVPACSRRADSVDRPSGPSFFSSSSFTMVAACPSRLRVVDHSCPRLEVWSQLDDRVVHGMDGGEYPGRV